MPGMRKMKGWKSKDTCNVTMKIKFQPVSNGILFSAGHVEFLYAMFKAISYKREGSYYRWLRVWLCFSFFF